VSNSLTSAEIHPN